MVKELRSIRLKEAAKKVKDGIEETLTYFASPQSINIVDESKKCQADKYRLVNDPLRLLLRLVPCLTIAKVGIVIIKQTKYFPKMRNVC